MQTGVSTPPQSDGLARHLAATLVLLLMMIGGFILWLGVPAAILWALGQIAESKAQHYLYALLAIPSGMLLFALLLIRINWLYLRLSRVGAEREGDQEERPRLRGPLDRILGVCSVIALVAVLGYLLFGGQHPEGGTVW
jgi:hypothetical protein